MRKEFLHSHPMMETRLGVPVDHVIVDRDEWEIAMSTMKKILEIEKKIEAGNFWVDFTTGEEFKINFKDPIRNQFQKDWEELI